LQTSATNWRNDISAILTEIDMLDSFQNEEVLGIEFCKLKLVDKQQIKWLNTTKPKLHYLRDVSASRDTYC